MSDTTCFVDNLDKTNQKELNVEHQTKSNTNLAQEMIYANNSVIKCSRMENALRNDSVPSGRKPALPPKPPNKAALFLGKPKGFVQSARAAIFDRKSPQGKVDPAEMTLKERLALFEKNKGAALMPKTPLAMSEQCNQTKIKDNCDHLKMPLLSDISTQKLIVVSRNSKSENARFFDCLFL